MLPSAKSWARIVRRIIFLIQNLSDMDRCCLLFGFLFRRVYFSFKDIFTFRIETANVRVEQGELRGRKVVSVQGKPYYKFQGIPYAKPPIGDLRFKNPQPPDNWLGVRDALKHGNICIHKDVFTGLVKGAEDCLFLNVYTPQLPEQNVDFGGKAVLFWIHGGGFHLGSGNEDIYCADYFMGEDVVVVTINYRLGALGFLSTGTEDAPGNAGLKDMVMALKWVNKNIAAFGGDPKRITIFGESAGAAAVQYLLLSPLAKGLFHRAISQSGSAGCPWASNSTIEGSFKLGKAFGFDTEDPKILVESLKKIPAKIIATRQNVALSEQSIRECIPFEFRPCVEPANSESAFITEDPRKLIEQGNFASDVPYMMGINEMEGMVMLKMIMDKRPSASEIDKDFERVIPRFMNLKCGTEKSKEVASKIREFYFGERSFNKHTYKEYIDLTTDSQFLEPFCLSTRGFLKKMKSPVYNYFFLFDGEFNFFKKILNMQDIPGPAHSDELFYMFYSPVLGQNFKANTKETKLMKRMVRLWTNFAKYGNPTPNEGDELLQNVVWKPVEKGNDSHLIIGEELSISHSGILKERENFWEELKKEQAGSQL